MSDTNQTPGIETTPLLMAKDPVCGMSVDPAKARGNAQHRGVSYCFCSPGCMHRFLSDPEKYVGGSDLASGAMAGSAPLPIKPTGKSHKDPVCGMSVDPFKASASVEHAGQLFHFCSKGCAGKFTADPAKYLSPSYIAGGMSASVAISSIATQPATTSGRDRPPQKPSTRPVPAAYLCPM